MARAPAAVSIFSDRTDALVLDGDGALVDTPLVDTGGTTVEATSGIYSSTTATQWSLYGDSADLIVTLSHVRGGDEGGAAYSQFDVRFTSSVPAYFTASGSYLNSNDHTLLSSNLHDGNTNQVVFNSSQESFAAPASFVLGGLDGNYLTNTTFEGVGLTGYLEANHLYEWQGIAFTQSLDFDSPLSVQGGLSLSIRPVPEVSTFIVWTLSVLTAGVACRRYRSTASVA